MIQLANEDAQKLVNYLQSRPYIEVAELIAAIVNGQREDEKPDKKAD